MKKVFAIILMSLCLVGCSASTDSIKGAKIVLERASGTVDIASSVRPAIVGISGETDSSSSVGSGVCVTESGHILTNSHVVHDCKDIVLYLADKSTTTADIVYEDTVLDLAILKSHISIPYLPLGSSDDLQVGQDVLAVGTPLSLTLVHSFTKGIISALNRTLKVGSSNGEGYMQNLIQHDASLNPGNSGGPLINSNGEVVGINTLKISSGEGIGFAIPTKSFRSLLSSLATKINYQVPKLGVYGFDNEIASYKGKNDLQRGFYILDVASTSPLKSIGVVSGSVITKINNRDVNNTLDLKDELYRCSAGQRVQVSYFKNGKNYTGNLVLD